MDIDMRSTSVTTIRPTSKRPRSPTSPSIPHDRPHKRLTLGSITSTTTMFPSGLPSPVPTPPPLTTRQLSEDWVSRTRGLKIDRDRVSPAIEEEPTLAAAAPITRDSDDVNMDDEFIAERCLPRAPGSAPVLSQPSPIRPQIGFVTQDMNSPCPGHIEIPRPKLSERSSFASQSNDPAPLTPTTPPRSSMDINPEDIALPLSPSRKPRFTMGPRLDCEKCRLRVPGHYSHFN